MKKVVNEVAERTISIDDINNESFVGVLWNSRTKSIVITCGNDEYIGINDDTIGLRHAWKKQTKKTICRNRNETGCAKCICF